MVANKIKNHGSVFFLAVAYLVIAVVGLKPVIDCAWDLRMGWGGFKTSFQGFIGVAFLCLSVALASISLVGGGIWKGISTSERHRLRIVATLFLVTLSVIAYSTAHFRQGLEFSLKYAAGAAGLFTVRWCLFYIQADRQDDRKYLFWLRTLVLVSLVVLCSSMLLQIVGVLPWQVNDLLPLIAQKGIKTWHEVPRVTGFYYHPLDVFRVAIWCFLVLLFFIFHAKKTAVRRFILLMIGFQVLALWTTHRASFFAMLIATVVVAFAFNAPKRGFLTLTAIAVGWLIGISSYVSFNGIQISSVFSKLHFVDSRPSVERRVDDSTLQSTKSLKTFAEMGVARGRSFIWYEHIQWIAKFSPPELAWGTREKFPQGKEAEPHSQVLDLVERFGFVGLFVFITLYTYSFVSLPVGWYWKGFALATLGWYGLITESLVMPTFSWWAMLFACVPIWFKSKDVGKNGI